MPPKKTAPPTPKRGTKRAATPADVEMEPVSKRTSKREVTPVVTLPARRSTRASTAEPTRRPTARSTSRGGTPGPGGQRRGPFVYVPKPGMNALPTAPQAEPGAPKRQLFVFGNGDMGQHGLGIETIDEIKRPRLHAWVAEKNEAGQLGQTGLEMIAAGGMHTLAIDSTGRILSWGINDNAALGRLTTRETGIDAEVYETEPMQVEGLSPTGRGPRTGALPDGGTEGEVEKFRATRVAAGDSISVALNDVGEVRVWGSFRSNDGLLGFDGRGSKPTQFSPVALPELINHSFVQVSCGDDHVLALATDGSVFSWGNGQQSQLGRRIIERRKKNGLTPERVALRKIVSVATGAYHSFAIDWKGDVWAWGLNSLHQLGMDVRGSDTVAVPNLVTALSPATLSKDKSVRVVSIAAGAHHSLFLLSDGRVFGAGRCDGCELGLAEDHPAKQRVTEIRAAWEEQRKVFLATELKEWEQKMVAKRAAHAAAGAGAGAMGMVLSTNEMRPTMGPPPDEYVPEPVHIPFPAGPDGKPTLIASIACGARHNLAVATDGTCYSWGFGPSSQLGQGDEESIETPAVVKSKMLSGFTTVAATAGGQHSALLAVKRPE